MRIFVQPVDALERRPIIFGRYWMLEEVRSRASRALAEDALVRVVHAYGAMPEFVLLGGLVPDVLCSRSRLLHLGTTDVDVQVNLEVVNNSSNARRLESALLEAGFTPDQERVWRWQDEAAPGIVVKAEFLADLDDVPNHRTFRFDDCQLLGAVNLRGTSYAVSDWAVTQLTSLRDAEPGTVRVRVAGLGGYLLAKIHPAHARRAPKDWYDIAFVLIHNNEGGPGPAGRRAAQVLGNETAGATQSALADLVANFADTHAQGPQAYAESMLALYSELDGDRLVNDAIAAVDQFVYSLRSS
jgi:hypothetical protein